MNILILFSILVSVIYSSEFYPDKASDSDMSRSSSSSSSMSESELETLGQAMDVTPEDFGQMSFTQDTLAPISGNIKYNLDYLISSETKGIKLVSFSCDKFVLDRLKAKAAILPNGVEYICNIQDPDLGFNFKVLMEPNYKIDSSFMIFEGQNIVLADTFTDCHRGANAPKSIVNSPENVISFYEFYNNIKKRLISTNSQYIFDTPQDSLCSDEIAKLINSERNSLKLWTSGLSNPKIIEALMFAAIKGVKLNLLLNKETLTPNSVVKRLDELPGVEVRVLNQGATNIEPCNSVLLGNNNNQNIDLKYALVGTLRAYRKDYGNWAYLKKIQAQDECHELERSFDDTYINKSIVVHPALGTPMS